MRVLGIDPGYERLGLAVVEKIIGKEKLLFSECFKTKAQQKMDERLFEIGSHLEKIMGKWKPDIISSEKLFFTTNQKTALHVSEVIGIINYLARKSGIEIREFTPLQIKIAITGYGRADKPQIASMLKNLIDIKEKENIIDDEYDAIAVALTSFASTKF